MTSRLGSLYGPRRSVLLVIFLFGLGAVWHLQLMPGDLVPSSPGWSRAGDFFLAAFSPALNYEDLRSSLGRICGEPPCDIK